MIINLDAAKRYYIMTGRTDLLKGVDSLAALVQNDYQLNPFERIAFSSASPGLTALKLFIGTAKVSGYCINAMNLAEFIGLDRRSH